MIKIIREQYRRKVYRAGRTVEIEETYPTRFGDMLTRERNSGGNGTPTEMENYNSEIAIRKLGRIIAENFGPNDWFVTFHYPKEARPPNLKNAKMQLSAFLTKLRLAYSLACGELKYIKTTARGERGGIHHHVILNGVIDTRIISKMWKEHIKAPIGARPPDFRGLYDTGEYSSLAAYLIMQPEKEAPDLKEPKKPLTDFIKETSPPGGCKNSRRWICSRNLKKPVEEPPRIIRKIKWKEAPAPWPGYYIDEYSIRAGCNPVNGRPYLFYRMVKLPPDFVCFDNNGKRLTGQKAISWFRNNSKEYIKQNWLTFSPEGEIIFKKGIKQNE